MRAGVYEDTSIQLYTLVKKEQQLGVTEEGHHPIYLLLGVYSMSTTLNVYHFCSDHSV